jgi:HemK family putative methylases
LTIKEFIEFAKQNLSSIYPLEEANSIAIRLLVDLANFKQYDYLVNPNKLLTETNSKGHLEPLLLTAIERLKQGEPLQHILGFEWFYGQKFKVSKDVLIPRPETEELVDLIIKEYNSSLSNNFSILDICTGSGCIIHTLALNLKQGNYYGCDISKKSLQIAEHQSYITEKYTKPKFFICDILNPQAESIINNNCSNNKFDIIVSNPPYICEKEKILMRNNVLNFEPHIALFVPDNNPLLFYTQIAKTSQSLLKKEELFILK